MVNTLSSCPCLISSENGTSITGQSRAGEQQEWIIKKALNGESYKIQNSTSKTFVDLYQGDSADGTKITGWQGTWAQDGQHQLWNFQRMSCSGGELRTTIKNNPHLSQDYRPYQLDGEYLILPQSTWKQIWETSGLKGKKWRREIFDCDDFAMVMKAAVANWGNGIFRADGFTILCGIMLGSKPGAGHAYNFSLTDDYSSVVFFEPQNSNFMADIGYKAYLAYY